MNQADSPNGPTITLLKHIMQPDACKSVTLASALHQIRSGRWKAEVEAIRSFDEAGDKPSAAEAKAQLPCFLFAGRFERANDNGLVSHSGLAVLDIDNLDPAKLAEVRGQAVGQAWVAATFTSPRGRGLKLVCRIGEQDSEGHKRTADALRGHCATLFNLEIDRGAEVSRKCFVSFDPDLYHNPSATAWTDLTDCFRITESRRVGESERRMLPLPLSLSSKLEAPAAIDPEAVIPLLKKWDLLPCKPHDTHHRLFKLARLAISDGEFGRTLSKSEKEGLFHAWHQATMALDPSFLSVEEYEYMGEFLDMLRLANTPLGNDVIPMALARAKTEPPPSIATHPNFRNSPTVQLLLALCYQLSLLSSKSGVFFLGCRDAGDCLNVSHDRASKMLRGLVAGGILTLAEKVTTGVNGKAARYKWVGCQ